MDLKIKAIGEKVQYGHVRGEWGIIAHAGKE